MPAAERPRERLQQRGPGGLSAAELIGLVWATGARGRTAVEVAEEALARHDGLTGLARASGAELEALPGVGAARAGGCAIAVLPFRAVRMNRSTCSPSRQISARSS